MDRGFFETQLARIANQYGPKALGEERVKIIWREVNQFTDRWFESLITEMIASCDRAPLPKQFSEAASRERDRLYLIEKAKNTREAEASWNWLTQPEVELICRTIRERMVGKIQDSNWVSFVQVLEQIAIVRGKK
jgi:hypothetical protein